MTDGSGLRERNRERTRAAIVEAALGLFGARGFDGVTLGEIADAAQVGYRTVFRYFADKEELLFDDDVDVQEHLRAALAGRPEGERPMVVVREALAELMGLWQDRRQQGRARRAIIEAAPALKARERLKQSAYEEVVQEELARRGVPVDQARLLARVGLACTHEATARWLSDDDPGGAGLLSHSRAVFAELAGHLSDVGPER